MTTTDDKEIIKRKEREIAIYKGLNEALKKINEEEAKRKKELYELMGIGKLLEKPMFEFRNEDEDLERYRLPRYYGTYNPYVDYKWVQVRKHKKWRTNKKWAKRYGYKKVEVPKMPFIAALSV